MNKFLLQVKRVLTNKEEGIDGILVTIGLCIIALVYDFRAGNIESVVSKDSLYYLFTLFLTEIVSDTTTSSVTNISCYRALTLPVKADYPEEGWVRERKTHTLYIKWTIA